MRFLRTKRVTEDRVVELIGQEANKLADQMAHALAFSGRPVEVKLDGKTIASAIHRGHPDVR